MAKRKPYLGHESWSAWNVHLWITNDADVYKRAVELLAARPVGCAALGFTHGVARALRVSLPEKTPDGAKYSQRSVELAMRKLLPLPPAKLEAAAKSYNDVLNGTIECPECGHAGPHEDNGATGNHQSWLCAGCHMVFDAPEIAVES